MEKLIPLLNERHNLEWVLWSSRYNWDYLFVKWDKDNKFYEETIISKKFWFIKRLVENDKIDIDKIDKKIRIYDYVEEYEEYDYVFPDIYKQLLMLLSISDTPIEDLISYLK